MRWHRNFACLAVVLIAVGCGRKSADYLERGNQRFAAGKYADAVLEYQKAIQKDHGFGEAFYRLALAELRLGRDGEALRALREAVRLMPQNEEAMAKLGDLCFDGYVYSPSRLKGLYDTAASMADRLLAKNPQSFDGLRLKGSLALLDQKPKNAIELLQKANQIRPMNGAVILSLTQALAADNRFPEAETLALQLIQQRKDYEPIYDVLYKQYRTDNRAQDAERILETKAANNPRNGGIVLQLADHYYQVRQPDRMAQTLQRLLDAPTDFPQARLLIGDFYNRKGNWEEALRQYEAGSKANSKDKVTYQIRIATVLASHSRRDEAIQTLDAALREHPDNDEAISARAAALMDTGKPENREAAVQALKELVRRRPDDASVRFSLGLAYMSKGDLESSKTELREAIRRQRDLDKARFLLANIALAQNSPADSLRYVEEILASSPQDPSARLIRAEDLVTLGRYPEARAELDRLARQYPESAEVQLQIGSLAVLEKRYSDAERTLQKLRSLGVEELRATFGLAESYARQREFDKAIQILSDEAGKAQGASARKLLAEIAVRAQRYDRAIAEYERLLAAEPKSVDLHTGLGEAYEAKGDMEKAIDQYRQARQNAPKDLTATLDLAAALHRSGRSNEALTIYRDLASSRPDDVDALNNLAYMLCETGGNLDEALKLAQRAAQKAPEQPGIVDTLGWIYLKKGMTDNAVRLFINLVQKSPDSPTFRYHLGTALLQKGDKVRAASELQSALRNKPALVEEKKIRELLARIG
jgi:tetratricopeptide (TPR) repeat protein